MSKHKQFNQIVDFVGNPFIEFRAKRKRVKKALSSWTRSAYGNIFQQISTIEDVIKVKEIHLKIQPSARPKAELSDVEVESKKYLQIEEDLCSVKTRMK